MVEYSWHSDLSPVSPEAKERISNENFLGFPKKRTEPDEGRHGPLTTSEKLTASIGGGMMTGTLFAAFSLYTPGSISTGDTLGLTFFGFTAGSVSYFALINIFDLKPYDS